jgi:PKD repeat protein
MKKIMYLFLSCVLFISCSDNNEETSGQNESLVADFSFDYETINESGYLGIENNSEGATTYTWDFGNGNVFTDEVPDFRYITHGIYDVTLTVGNDLGDTHSIVKTVNVLCVFGGGSTGVEHSDN